MKHVNRIRRADGSVHLYLRKKGLPCARLPDGLSDEELAEHVARLIGELTPGSDAPPVTLRGALRAYELESPDFRGLAASTQYEYRLILRELEEDLGKLLIKELTPAVVHRLKTLWSRRGHRAANVRLQVLKNVLKPALIDGTLGVDPFPLVGQVRRPRGMGEPHLAWPDTVLETVLAEALGQHRYGLARAVAIARYTGARRGDLVRLAPTAREGGRFRFLSGKRRIGVDIPEDPRLAAWLDGTPDGPPASGRSIRAGLEAPRPPTLIYNRLGRPYTEDGLGQELAKLVRGLFEDGLIDTDRYDLHGLRHTRGVELAMAGCSDAEGAAMMGHGSASSFVQYRRQADRPRLADAGARRLEAHRARLAAE